MLTLANFSLQKVLLPFLAAETASLLTSKSYESISPSPTDIFPFLLSEMEALEILRVRGKTNPEGWKMRRKLQNNRWLNNSRGFTEQTYFYHTKRESTTVLKTKHFKKQLFCT